MTALNSLEILTKFLGNPSSSGVSLEMIRSGLFEEQLKLASQSRSAPDRDSPQKNSVPLIKKTLPIGPAIPAPPPTADAPPKQEKGETDSSSASFNLSSSPHRDSSENSTPQSRGEDTSSVGLPTTGQNQLPHSEDSQTPDKGGENESTELTKIVLPEDASEGSVEGDRASVLGEALLKEISQKEASKNTLKEETKEENSNQNFQTMAAGENGLMVVVSQSAPAEQILPEDQPPADQASMPISAAKEPTTAADAPPETFLPGLLPSESAQKTEGVPNGQAANHPAGSSPEPIPMSTELAGKVQPSVSVLPIPSGNDSTLAVPQGMTVSLPTPAVSGVASTGGSTSAVSGVASAGTSQGASGVIHEASQGNFTSSTANPSKAKSPADPEGSSQEVSVQRVRFVQRVARAFQTLQDGGGSVRLRLHPPELGSLRMELTVRDGLMRARMEVENNAARTAILEHLPMLRERLAQQDIRIEQFEVEIGGDSSGAGSQQPGESMSEQQGSSFAPPTTRPRPTEPTLTPSGGNPLRASESTKLNVVI